jgi:hypothetical protein
LTSRSSRSQEAGVRLWISEARRPVRAASW